MKAVEHTFPWKLLRGSPAEDHPCQHLVENLWKLKSQQRLMDVESTSPLEALTGPQEMRDAKSAVSVLWVSPEHGVNPMAQAHGACQ
jgi:hypothetical protein